VVDTWDDPLSRHIKITIFYNQKNQKHFNNEKLSNKISSFKKRKRLIYSMVCIQINKGI
jgi:hypothetical protein